MKTADLIPLILLELNESDKYGLELSKNIEDKSNGKIVIKQPTLYTVLKKLEKSKFISSYWLDSEIGGKRHYYKITDNGKLQVSTLPSFTELMNLALSDETTEEEPTKVAAPIVSTIPSEEVFAENNIDTITNQENNENNIKLLNDNADENFADNTDVTKFMTTTPNIPLEAQKSREKNEIINFNDYTPSINNTSSIKYIEYTNLQQDKNYLSAKKYVKCRIWTSFVVSLYLFATIIATLFILKIENTKLMGVTMFFALFAAIFYPAITLSMKHKIRKNAPKHLSRHSSLASIYLSIIIFILGFIALEVYNLFELRLQFVEMFEYSNFANLHLELIVLFATIINSLVYNIIKYNIRKVYDTNS